MNERDRQNTTSTWPPPQLAHEKGNSDKTVVVPAELLQRLLDSGTVVIDDPDQQNPESSG